jgi:hypothetical protein
MESHRSQGRCKRPVWGKGKYSFFSENSPSMKVWKGRVHTQCEKEDCVELGVVRIRVRGKKSAVPVCVPHSATDRGKTDCHGVWMPDSEHTCTA